MKLSFLRFVLPFAALAAFVAPGSAFAQKAKPDTGGSTSGPVAIPGGTHATTYVISQPGSYLLSGNRVMSDGSKHAIEITAADVTLDLGGHSLSFADGRRLLHRRGRQRRQLRPLLPIKARSSSGPFSFSRRGS